MDGGHRLGRVVDIRRSRLKHGACAQGRFVLFHQLSCAPILLLQRPHHRDQIIVADAFKVADAIGPRLRVRLPRDQINKGLVKIGHIHQLGPGPFQCRTELRHEMLHPRFATGNAIRLEQAHLRPPDAKAIADGVVDLFRGGDAVLDQPERLAPDSFEQTVGHMGVDLFAQMQRVHPKPRQQFLGAVYQRAVLPLGRDQFNQRQKVDGVERMGDHDLIGARAARAQF